LIVQPKHLQGALSKAKSIGIAGAGQAPPQEFCQIEILKISEFTDLLAARLESDLNRTQRLANW
jgi:hypothetical protein